MERNTSYILFLSYFLIGCSSIGITDSPSVAVSSSPAVSWKPKQPPKEKLQKITSIPDGSILSIGEILDLSLHNNPETARLWTEAKIAASDYQISLARYYPEITFEADASRYYDSFGFAAGTSSVSSAVSSTTTMENSAGPSASLSYTLFDFGARSANADKFLYTLQSANFAFNQSIQQLIQQTLISYYNLLYQKSYERSLKLDLADAKETLVSAETKLSTGVVSVSDVLQAKASYLQSKLALEKQQSSLAESYNSLANRMGISSATLFQVDNFPDVVVPIELSLSNDALLKIAYNSRPDIQELKSRLSAQKSNLRYTEAELWPTIGTSMEIGRRWFEHIPGQDNTYMLALNLNYPLFSGFEYINQMRKAKSQVKSAELLLTQKELEISRSVMNSKSQYEASKQTVLTAKEYVEAAAEEFTVLLAQYKEGTVTIIDVLNAQTQLSNARRSYAETIQQYYQSLADLTFSLGILFSPSPESILSEEIPHE